VKTIVFERDNLVKWMKLSLVHGLGPKRISQLFGHFESMEEIFSAPSDKLLKTGIFSPGMLGEFEKLKIAADEKYFGAIDDCAEKKIQVVPLLDARYPQKLFDTPSPPLTIFLQGNFSLLKHSPSFAIVGSRNANELARNFAFDSAKALCKNGFVVISGGASGIDAEAHKGALDSNGKTIAIMGTGLSHFYPAENKELFEEIIKKGLLISEHLPNFPGDRISFLQRNRITSGLSDGLLFCASESIKSGTATQLKIANSQKKPIFCPNLDLGILPNFGIKEAISEYGARQVRDADEIVSAIKNNIKQAN